MSETLLVIIGDSIAGTLTRLPGGKLQFDYADQYAAAPDATPLSLSMPTAVRSHPDHVVSPWLWNLLPDSNAVIERWARQFHLSRPVPFMLLGTVVGADCAGAVRFARPEDVGQALARIGHVAWLTEDDVAERLRELRQDSTSWLGSGTFTGQFSLAGVQAKTALLSQDGRWGVPSGSTPTTHILKPAIAGLDEHDLNEHLCLDSARRAGLATVVTRVMRFGDESAIVIDRYDRLRTDSGITRVHQEDFCQALAVPPTRKYQNEGGPGVVDVVELLRASMPPQAAETAVWRFADALIWNWIIGGTDAHAKNYSLLLTGDQIRLAPLYDIASALPYGDHEKKLRLAMKVGGDYHLNPYRNRWPAAARDLGLDTDEMVARVRELAVAAPDAFADAGKAPDVVALGSDLPSQLGDLIAERTKRCISLLDIAGQDSRRSPYR
jgi:serine/threonine-protein kinase HipA